MTMTTTHPAVTACLTYPDADHTACPSSVECFHASLPTEQAPERVMETYTVTEAALPRTRRMIHAAGGAITCSSLVGMGYSVTASYPA